MRKALPSIVRSVVLVAGLFSLVACGGSNDKVLGKYGEQCMASEDCDKGLMCLNRVCTLNCTADTQCQARDPKSTCNAAVCANRCVDTNDCPPGLQCVMRFSGTTCSLP